MLEDLIEAIQIGREAGNLVGELYNGDHYDAVNKAYEMAQSLDVNDHYEEGVREILDQLNIVDKNDRDFVKAAAYDLRARCYFDLGDYAKARQNITACLNIQIDSFTLEKDCIREHQKSMKELRAEIDKACRPAQQQIYDRKNHQKQKQQKQIQSHSTDKLYSREELLSIISKCENIGPLGSIIISEDSYITSSKSELMERLENWYNIKVSKSQLSSVNTYKGLIDIIISHTVVPESNENLPSNGKHHNPIYLTINRTESVFTLDGKGGVQCFAEISRQGRLNYIEGHTKIVIVNPSGKNSSAVVQGVESKRNGYFGTLSPNNSVKVGETIRIKLSNINEPEVECGAKIYLEEDYQKFILSSSRTGADMDNYSTPFSMPVEDVFYIQGRGTIITGRIESGRIKVGDTIYLGKGGISLTATVLGIEMFRKLLNEAECGDNVGLLLEGVSKDQIIEGMVASSVRTKAEVTNSSSKETTSAAVVLPTAEQEYIDELKECLADGEIGAGERRLLGKLAAKLGISAERAEELEASLSSPILSDDEKEYLEEFKAAAVDGVVSEKERRLLDKLKKMYGISDERAREIEKLV